MNIYSMFSKMNTATENSVRKGIAQFADAITEMATKKEKPATLGEGLKRVKKFLGIKGQNVSETPGIRVYSTGYMNISADGYCNTIGPQKDFTRGRKGNTKFTELWNGQKQLSYTSTPFNSAKSLSI